MALGLSAPVAAPRPPGQAAPSPLGQSGYKPPAAPAAPTTPNYKQLLAGDPTYQQTNANILADKGADLLTRNQGAQSALINYGAVPAGVSSSLIGPDTAAQALQATQGGVSAVAQNARNYVGANLGAQYAVAARGMGQSGELGQRLNANLADYNQAGYAANQKLMDYLSGLQSSYESQLQTLRNQRVTAEQGAQNRLNQEIRSGALGSLPPSLRGPVYPGTYVAHGGAA